MNIWKEREKIYILRTGANKPYTLDLEQGILYSMIGKPLKMVSSQLQIELSTYARLSLDTLGLATAFFLLSLNNNSSHISHPRNKGIYTTFNQVISISSEKAVLLAKNNGYNLYRNIAEFSPEMQKTFLRALSKNELEEYDYHLYEWVENYKEKAIAPYLEKSHYHFADFEKKMLTYAFSRNMDYFKLLLYVTERGWAKVLGTRYLEDIMWRYCENCKDLNIKINKEKDMMAEMVKVHNIHLARSMEISDKKISDFMSPLKDKLFFENEEFQVIVPMTKQEFLDEGESQNNCVARMYLPKVEHKERIIVFIRKKSDLSKSYITCEIYTDAFHIGQFLGKNNSCFDTDSKENAFRQMYQEHLKKVFNIKEDRKEDVFCF